MYRNLYRAFLTALCLAGATHSQVVVSDGQVFDFGHVATDFLLTHTYKLPNVGSTPVKLTRLEINCDCSSGNILDSIIQPGDTGRVVLYFTTKNYYGPTSKSLKVHTDHPQSPVIELFYLSIIGQWFDGIRPNPNSLFLLPGKPNGTVDLLYPATDSVTIESVYNASEQVFAVKHATSGDKKTPKLSFEIIPNASLPKGTHTGDFTVHVRKKADPSGDPMILTIPVKIVRY